MYENFGKPGHHGYRAPCGCVNSRDFKGYGVRQLCDRHFAEAADRILESRSEPTGAPA